MSFSNTYKCLQLCPQLKVLLPPHQLADLDVDHYQAIIVGRITTPEVFTPCQKVKLWIFIVNGQSGISLSYLQVISLEY